jgi:hypothetical protein
MVFGILLTSPVCVGIRSSVDVCVFGYGLLLVGRLEFVSGNCESVVHSGNSRVTQVKLPARTRPKHTRRLSFGTNLPSWLSLHYYCIHTESDEYDTCYKVNPPPHWGSDILKGPELNANLSLAYFCGDESIDCKFTCNKRKIFYAKTKRINKNWTEI